MVRHYNRPIWAQRFRIHAQDPRFAFAEQPVPASTAELAENQARMLQTIRSAAQAAAGLAYAPGTLATCASHWKYWLDFCRRTSIPAEDFASLQPGELRASTERINAEADVLAAFATFVVLFPQRRPRQGAKNTAGYAEQCVASVRSAYDRSHGRRPGLASAGEGGGHIRLVLRGLHKLSPSGRRIKRPLLQQHLRAIRRTLKLRSSQRDSTLWALWTCLWQGVLRIGDLIKRKREGIRPWSQLRDTHRGRLYAGIARDEDVRAMGAKFMLRLKPTKTDPTGEKEVVKTFVHDPDPESIDAAAALRAMLAGDRVKGMPEEVPLFRDPLTGGEVTYENSSTALRNALLRAGISDEGRGIHSFRVGGATAYANAKSGGEMIASAAGGWASDAKRAYLWAGEGALAAAALEIGRRSATELGAGIRPWSACARRRGT